MKKIMICFICLIFILIVIYPSNHHVQISSTHDDNVMNDICEEIMEQKTPLASIKNTKNQTLTAKQKKYIQKKLIDLINKDRKKKKRKAVKVDTRLEKSSSIRVKEISQKFSHTRLNGKKWYTAIKIKNLTAGENLAKIRGKAKSKYSALYVNKLCQTIHRSLMNSPSHKKVILNSKYRYIGISIHCQIKNQKLYVYVVEHFRK